MQSFYSLALNRRHTAYALAGSSVRLAIVMGLHLNVPESQLSDAAAREHRNRVWWTAYTFDRMWAGKLGNPVAVQDKDIKVNLPADPGPIPGCQDFYDPTYLTASLQLARISTMSISSIYSRSPQEISLSQRVQKALKDLREWAHELPPHLQIESTEGVDPRQRPIPLHLRFNQVRTT